MGKTEVANVTGIPGVSMSVPKVGASCLIGTPFIPEKKKD